MAGAHDLAVDVKRSDFPEDFRFGVGTAAFQVEGAWDASDKGPSIWDHFCEQHPDKIKGGGNAKHAVEHYAKFKEDVQLLKNMGVNSYRFSISWSRILPGGTLSKGKSTKGIDHYNKLIDHLLANGIEPFVTLFHWDLPYALEEDYKGFLSPNIVDDFVEYANICFWEFGDRVKNWITVNEPYRYAHSGYVDGSYPPCRGGKDQDGNPMEPYTVAYNLLNCHAATYRKYEEDYKDYQKGRVGISLDSSFFKPYRGENDEQDVKAVDYAFDFMIGWIVEPLTRGTWPENMKSICKKNGRVLPSFCDPGKVIDSYDFLAINYYTSSYVQYQGPSNEISPGYATDCQYKALGKDSSGKEIGKPAFEGSWLSVCPNELTELLYLIKEKYKISKDIIITENGFPDNNDPDKTYKEVQNDTDRIKYLKDHLKAIQTARSNNVNVTGYFVWSFMDSFEWLAGYTNRFGMIYVDFKDHYKRYPKNSAIWFKKFLSGKKLLKRSITDSEKGNEVDDTQAKRQKGN